MRSVVGGLVGAHHFYASSSRRRNSSTCWPRARQHVAKSSRRRYRRALAPGPWPPPSSTWPTTPASSCTLVGDPTDAASKISSWTAPRRTSGCPSRASPAAGCCSALSSRPSHCEDRIAIASLSRENQPPAYQPVYALLPQRPQPLPALPVARARSWPARCLTAAPTTVRRHARMGSRGSRCCGLLPTTSYRTTTSPWSTARTTFVRRCSCV